jgi:hypothetical protein
MAGKRDPSSHRTPEQIRKMNREYDSLPHKIQQRVNNKKARRMLEKEGLVRKGDGKDVDHIRPVRNGGSNSRKNLRAIPASKNRGWRDGV